MATAAPPTPSRSLAGLHRGEEGMLSLVSLFVVLAFLVLIGLLANVGMVTSRKIETQNAADAVAYSAAVEMARGMNAVTAVNHLIGELTALVVLIHSLAGDDPLESGKQPESTPQDLKNQLTFWHEGAVGLSADTDVSLATVPDPYSDVSQEPAVSGAIRDSRMRLKQVLIWAYEVHCIGGAIAKGQYIPIIGGIFKGAGEGIEGLASTFEVKIEQEWLTLDVMEMLAKGPFQVLKVFLRDALIPALNEYNDLWVQKAYLLPPTNPALKAAEAAASANLCDDHYVYPELPLLPIHQEDANLSDAVIRKSQLVRASTPWIQWWRQPWMDFGKQWLILSRFACFYEGETTGYTIPIIQKLKAGGVNLYVLHGFDITVADKTNEPWTTDSEQADQLFTVVGLVHRPKPVIFSSNIYQLDNQDRLVCYAQAMIYNANPQQLKTIPGNSQPIAGWDTLNWNNPANNPVPEYSEWSDDGGSCPTPSTPQPLIRLNWQAKLIPVTRFQEVKARMYFQRSSIAKELQRLGGDSPFQGMH